MSDSIRQRVGQLQRERFEKLGFSTENMPILGGYGTPVHQPEMLLIGCVDARLDPHADIGIPQGKALIYRNIAALVAGRDGGAGDRMSVAAALEFAVNSMHVEKIVVMGHTGCGGIRAFMAGDHEDTHHVYDYLKPLEQVHLEGTRKGDSPDALARTMEKAAVEFSLENLMTYDAVSDAVEEGRLSIEGWMLDTGNKLIWQLDPKSRQFRPIASQVSDK